MDPIRQSYRRIAGKANRTNLDFKAFLPKVSQIYYCPYIGKNILVSSSLFRYLYKHKTIAVIPNCADR